MFEENQTSYAPENTGFINVRVGTFPGRVYSVVLNGERTAGAALAAGDIDCDSGSEVRINGIPAESGLDTPIGEGDVVCIVNKIRGN